MLFLLHGVDDTAESKFKTFDSNISEKSRPYSKIFKQADDLFYWENKIGVLVSGYVFLKATKE